MKQLIRTFGSGFLILGLSLICQASEVQALGKAHSLSGSVWLNAPASERAQLASLQGHVSIVTFWTSHCINCFHNLSYIQKWQDHFSAKGVKVIGVHTPETRFERGRANVASAIKRYRITYPVLVDDDSRNWDQFHQAAWPTVYIVDQAGKIRSKWEGELEYDNQHGFEKLTSIVESLLDHSNRAQSKEMANTIINKHPLAIRWFHWINFPVIMIMIWSGMLIYWANDVFTVTLFGHKFFSFFPAWFYSPPAPAWVPEWLTSPGMDDSGHPTRYLWILAHRLSEGMSWHFLFAWFFAINGLCYVSFLAKSGEWKVIIPKLAAFKEAIYVVLYDLKLYKGKLPVRKYNAAQQIAYTMVIVMGSAMLITGIAIYKPQQQSWLTQLIGGYTVARFIHFWTTMGFVGFFLIHVGQVVKTGWNNFRGMITGLEIVTEEEKAILEPSPEAAHV